MQQLSLHTRLNLSFATGVSPVQVTSVALVDAQHLLAAEAMAHRRYTVKTAGTSGWLRFKG
jgi:hypothetical protein